MACVPSFLHAWHRATVGSIKCINCGAQHPLAYAACSGNPVIGFTFTGPFHSLAAADAFVERMDNVDDQDGAGFVIVTLYPPVDI